MDHHHHQYHHHHHQQQQQQVYQQNPNPNADGSDRFPQWSVQETKELLMIRADLDQTFMETKRNKLLWEVIATRMKEKGFNRSPEQCKCKWKNLVTRYKGCETIEAETIRQQFPFYNELQAIFSARMQRMLWAEAEGGVGGAKKKAMALSSDDDDDIADDISEGEQKSHVIGTKKKAKKMKSIGSGSGTSVRAMLDEFMRQQERLETQWREAVEAREAERHAREAEWRHQMAVLESERLAMERSWREKEEQRRAREEARAEKRDALIAVLLNKLRRDDS